MKKVLLLLSPMLLFAYTIDFETSLEKTVQMNKGLKAKKLSIDLSKEELDIANGYDYGSLVFNENISRTNNAGYVFGMKLSSREANFNDFGFDEFLSQMNGLPGNTNQLLNTQPKNLNYPEA